MNKKDILIKGILSLVLIFLFLLCIREKGMDWALRKVAALVLLGLALAWFALPNLKK